MPRVPEDVRKVRVDALSLDLNNFRFAVEQPDETMAFNYLFDEEDVMPVALSLLREGYRTNEVPLVVEEGGRFIVLEANRRISALRAIRNPSLVPNHEDALNKLVRRYQTDADDLPDEIYVTVYPDRATAAPVLARQHIGEDKKRWGLDEQAKFVLAQLHAGSDVKTLRATLTGIKDVTRLVRMGRVRQSLRLTAYTDNALAAYAAGGDLKMSAFEYAYKDKRIRPLLGFEFDDEGNVVARPTSSEQVAVLERLLRGFQNGELSTRRVLNDKKGKAYEALIAELEQLAAGGVVHAQATTPTEEPRTPAGGAAGHTAPPSGAGTGAASSATQTASGSPRDSLGSTVGPNHPDTKRKLTVSNVDYAATPSGLQKRFQEMRKIDIEDHPAAAAMLLRSVVESTIKHHYTSRGNLQVSGMLSQVVPQVATDYGTTKTLVRSIQLLQNSLAPKDRPGSGSWFNAASHDPVMVINAQQVREAWQELEPLVRFLLQ